MLLFSPRCGLEECVSLSYTPGLKTIDIAGNQLVLEQKLGIIAPDSAKFTIEYAQKTKGVSKTTDLIIDAQIKKVIDYRLFVKNNETEIDLLVEKSLQQEGCQLSKSDLKALIKRLLDIEILSYQLEQDKIDYKIWQYQ